MTLVTADDKGRLCIRGTKTGHKYLVQEADGGWWIKPVPEVQPPKPGSRNRREWTGSKLSLDEHLQELSDLGFRFERSELAKELVPPCRF